MKNGGHYLQLISWAYAKPVLNNIITDLKMVRMYMCKPKGREGASKNIMNVTCIRKNTMLYLNSKL